MLAIEHERSAADERGELARCRAPREIHLKEALLRVDEPLGAEDIDERVAADPRHGVRVELDRHGGVETGKRRCSGASGQGRGGEQVRAEQRYADRYDQGEPENFERSGHVKNP